MKKAGTFFLKRDDLKLGIVLGLITPIIVFFFLYYFRFGSLEFGEFLDLLITEKGLITFFGAWSLVANIAIFTVYINTDRDQTGKGIFAVTLLYGVGVLLLKALL